MSKKRKAWKWKRRKWRYFYYDNKLHKTIRIHRGKDECWAWCYSDRKKYIYAWSDIQRRGEPAISLKEAAEIINRSPGTVYNWILEGLYKPPEQTYSLETGNPGHYKLSRSHVNQLHELVSNRHFGRPRKDGEVTQRNVPNKQEVRAATVHGLFLYAKKDDGEFVPIWKSEEF